MYIKEPAWKTHVWKKGQNQGKSLNKQTKKFHFKQIARYLYLKLDILINRFLLKIIHRTTIFFYFLRAVKFTSKLFGQALSRRIKATILYATETGRSEMYAKKLGEIFARAFHSQVHIVQIIISLLYYKPRHYQQYSINNL